MPPKQLQNRVAAIYHLIFTANECYPTHLKYYVVSDDER